MEKQGNFVYIVKCRDGSYYTGWTTDVEKRVREHNGGSKGAKYTRGRRPVFLVYTESFDTPNEAMSREWHIKHMTRQEKEQLIHEHAVKQNVNMKKVASGSHIRL